MMGEFYCADGNTNKPKWWRVMRVIVAGGTRLSNVHLDFLPSPTLADRLALNLNLESK